MTAAQAVLIFALMVSTLDEGGARPSGMLATHLLVVVSLLLVLARRAASPWRLDRVPHIALVAFFLCVAVGAIHAPYAFAALLVCVELAVFWAVLWISASAGAGWTGRLAWPLLLVAAGQSLLAIFQRVVDGVPRPAGTFLNPNHLAGWLVAALIVGVAGCWSAAGLRERIVRLFLALPPVVALSLTASRGALAGLVLAALWWSWISWRRMSPRGRRVWTGAMIVLLLGASWIVAGRFDREDPFRYHRVRIWRSAIQPALDHPWAGVGPGQWFAASQRYNFPNLDAPLRYERILDSTHSDLIRAPAEFGWPATLALAIAVALAVSSVRRRRELASPEVLAALAALVAMAGQACVDNPSQRPALYLLAAALLGAVLAVPTVEGPPSRGRSALWLAAALVWIWCVADLAPYLAWRSAAGTRADLDRSLRLNPLHYDAWMRRAEMRAASGPGLSPEVYGAVREDAETAVRLNPEDAPTRVRRARLERRAFFELFGDLASRRRVDLTYREAERLSPWNAFIPIELGEFLLQAGDTAGARRAAERALAVEPEAVPALLLLADTLLAQGGDAARERAAGLMARAGEIETRLGPTAASDYGRRLLRADPAPTGVPTRRPNDGSAP